MLKAISLVVTGMLVLSISLVGCGSSDTKSETSTVAVSTAAAEATVTPAPEPVEITYSTFRAEDEAIFKGLIEKFQTENTSIKVKFDTNKDTAAYDTTLMANIQSGAAADVFDVHPSNQYVSFAREGVAVDLSDMDFVKNYADGPKALTTIDGKIYGYNHAINLICMIYSKEAFKKAGVDVPKDFNDFVAIMKKLKDSGYGGVAYAGGDVKSAWIRNQIFNEIMGADAYKKFMEGIDSGDIVTIKDNAQVYSALKTLSAYNKNNILYANSVSVKYPQSLSLFAQKKAAIVNMGTWTFGTKETDYPGIDVGIFATPTLDQTTNAYAEPAQISMVNAASKNIDAAKKWVNFLANAENAATYISKTKMTPTIKGVKADFDGGDILSAQMDKGVVVLPILAQPNNEFYLINWDTMNENILFKGADVDMEIAKFEAALKKADLKNKK